MFLSKRFRNRKILLLLLVAFLASCGPSSGSINPENIKGYAVVAESAGGAFSEKWQESLSRQLKKRSDKSLIVSLKEEPELFTITLGKTAPTEGSYCIHSTKNSISIRAIDDQAMTWVLYQMLRIMGQRDTRIRIADLPPATIELKEECGNFAFEYREPYFAPNLDYDYAGILGTNNVERDWGIWGHGLKKVITKDPAGDVYALVDGKRNLAQFCASSPAVYSQLVDSIGNGFGNGDKQTVRFAILPNDNSLVCLCPKCKAAGNTEGNATPAFTALLVSLASRFPKHQFFTSAYLTTRRPPQNPLPENAGVLISAIDLPLGISYNSGGTTQTFVASLQQWKSKTSHLYVWDYSSDFDDYFTPFPSLYTLQARLKLFRANGVKGVFLNGSGYEYTTFEDLKTYVMAALLMNPDQSVDALCRDYLKQQYPVTEKLTGDYYLGLEKRVQEKKKPLSLYGGMREAAATYFDVPAFVAYYDGLQKIKAKAGEAERAQLNRILTAGSFTRLRAARYQGLQEHGFLEQQGNTVRVKRKAVEDALESLDEGLAHFGNMRQYSESERMTADYIAAWRTALDARPDTSVLTGKTLTAISVPDEEYSDLKTLTDGVRGFEKDYHDGWLIAGGDDMIYRIPNDGAKTVVVSFLEDPQFNIFLPQSVEVTSEDQQTQGSLTGREKTGNITSYRIDISHLKGNTLRFQAFRQRKTGKSMLACDEILLH